MNWLDREMLGLRRKDKLGAPRYYELSEGQKDAIAYSAGVAALVGADWWEKQNRAKSLREAEERRKLEEQAREQREKLKNDTSFRPEPEPEVRRAEPVTPATPVEKTPATPKSEPVQAKVQPVDVQPRTPEYDPDR